MNRRKILLMLLTVIIAVHINKGNNCFASAAAPLSPSLLCSACEVTAREIFYGYVNISKKDRFAGTEVELATVMEEACTRLKKYIVAQEGFGAHMKVFADPSVKYDIQNIEQAQWYSQAEEANTIGSTYRLLDKCEELVGEFEDDIADKIKERVDEGTLKKWMCQEKTNLCAEEVLKRFAKKESKRRKSWKRKAAKSKMREKLEKEMNEGAEL